MKNKEKIDLLILARVTFASFFEVGIQQSKFDVNSHFGIGFDFPLSERKVESSQREKL
jgi:hypothetical protein